MTFVKLQDTFPENHKVSGLSDGAFRLYVTALCYAARNRTDGMVPRRMLKVFQSTPVRAKELFDVGLWECPQDFDGWRIHDYLKHNRSRERIEDISEKRKAAAEARHDHVAQQSVVQVAHQNGVQQVNPYTRDQRSDDQKPEVRSSKVPVPPPENRSPRHWFTVACRQEPPRDYREQVDALADNHPPECIRYAFEEAIAHSKDELWNDRWFYARKILRHPPDQHEPRLRSDETDELDGFAED